MSDRISFSDSKYRSGRERLQPFKIKMLELVKNHASGCILDIGCGTGVLSEQLSQFGFKVYACDISPVAMASYAQAGFNGVVSNAENPLPFKSEAFDAVWMSEVLEHIVNYRSLLEEAGRVLKHGGCLFLTTPNSSFYGYRLLGLLGKCPTEMQHPFHVRFFSFGFLCKELVRCGFEIDRTLGQNIYFVVPPAFMNQVRRISRHLADSTQRVLRTIGFDHTEGLIHGDKMLCYSFSSKLTGLLSNVIIIVARKPKPADSVGLGTANDHDK